MQVYRDIHRVRELYHEQYVYALRNKIDKQKEDIKRKTIQMEQKLDKERQFQASLIAKKRPQHHDLKPDTEFLRKLPKTQYYKVKYNYIVLFFISDIFSSYQ